MMMRPFKTPPEEGIVYGWIVQTTTLVLRDPELTTCCEADEGFS
jgi:hypothetical protein